MQHSPIAFSPHERLTSLSSWLTGRRLVGGVLVLMGSVGLVATALGWYPAP